MSERILVAVDFSDASVEALREAHERVRARGGQIAVVNVVPHLVDAQASFSESYGVNMMALAEAQKATRAAAEKHVREILAGEDVPVFVEEGEGYAEIVRRAEAWPAELIVVGSHGRTGLSRVLIGSVAERVTRYAHCPVLVARPHRGDNVVVVATDLSDPSLPALAAGVEEAKARGARLVVAHSFEPTVSSYLAAAGAPFGAFVAVPPPEVQKSARDAVAELLAASIKRFGGIGEARVLDGAPVASVIRAVEELRADVLVVGTHGRTGLSRVALGSTAEQLVRLAPCSVFVVRQHSPKT